ncbi:MAG: hypothetical protein AAGN35_13370 [Bacteroidota bacterium]
MAENYQRILTDLYRLYQPDKVSEVPELLRRFEGREREMVYKIHIKYGSPETQRDAREKLAAYLAEKENPGPPVPQSPHTPLSLKPPPSSPKLARKVPRTSPTSEVVEVRTQLNWRRIAWVLLSVLLVGSLSYAGWQLVTGKWTPFALNEGAGITAAPLPPRFVLANAVHARTECQGREKSRDILRYGSELRNYSVVDDCLVLESDSGARYFPGKYFVPEIVFREIDAIFGNDAARSQIRHSFEKRALRVWFRQNGVMGSLAQPWKDSIAGPDRDPQVWQIFAEDEPSDLNVWARGQFSRAEADPTRPDDLAVTITSLADLSQEKLLVFSFDAAEEAQLHPAFDLGEYPDRLIREFPREGDEWSRFFRQDSDYPAQQGILLEDPQGTRPDYLLLLENEGLTVTEEVPRDTIRIPGLPPIIL